ncbi:MAG: hypothetical protein WDN06_19905 [Asticcacaulis sp.]
MKPCEPVRMDYTDEELEDLAPLRVLRQRLRACAEAQRNSQPGPPAVVDRPPTAAMMSCPPPRDGEASCRPSPARFHSTNPGIGRIVMITGS